MPFATMQLFSVVLLNLLIPSSSLLFYENYHKYRAEYCNMEILNITCPLNHVIMIIDATYGRMKVGRCMQQQIGKEQCVTNSFPFLDAKCSGRNQCIFQVPDTDLYETNPCPSDFTSYLQATHICVPVAAVNDSSCRSYRLLKHLNSGFISSLQPNSSHSFHPFPSSSLNLPFSAEVGTFRCPWLLEARQGQRLNISLHTILHYKYRSHSDKWSLKSNSLTSDDASYHPHFSNDGCVEVGVVVDGGVGRRVVKVCQGNARFDHVMLTKTHVARIEFNTLSLLNQLGIFIFEFTTIGCASIAPSADSWQHLQDNLLYVHCNYSKQVFQLECKESQWYGHLGNCSHAQLYEVSKLWGLNHMFGSEESFPFGVLVAVSIGVAMGIVIGGFLLCMITFYLKRQRQTSSFGGYNTPKEQQHFLPYSNAHETPNSWTLHNHHSGPAIKKSSEQPLDLCQDNSDVLVLGNPGVCHPHYPHSPPPPCCPKLPNDQQPNNYGMAPEYVTKLMLEQTNELI